VAQGGEIPSAILGADQMDLGSIDLKTPHNQLTVEDERLDLNANAQSFSGEDDSYFEQSRQSQIGERRSFEGRAAANTFAAFRYGAVLHCDVADDLSRRTWPCIRHVSWSTNALSS
jgi:hypothetical protein